MVNTIVVKKKADGSIFQSESITVRNTSDLSVASAYTRTTLLPLNTKDDWKTALDISANNSANLDLINSYIIGNAATTYANSVAYVNSKSYVNTSQLSANLALYQTIGNFATSVAELTANNTSFAFSKNENALNVNSAITSNNSTYAFGKAEINLNVNSSLSSLTSNNSTNFDGISLTTLQSQITANSANAYANSVAYVNSKLFVNTSQLSANLSNYANLSGAVFTGQVNVSTLNTLGNTSVGGSLIVSGNLTISGNVTVIGANNLSLVDNMIYLNSGSSTTNPDIGFAGNYNDGTYAHTGIFRDHASGTWKVFDNYALEPDASIYINQSDPSFHIANFQANTIFIGNNTVYSTINATSFNGVSNNTLNAFGKSEVNLNVNNALFSNSATYLGSANLLNITTYITSNATAAYANSITYVDGKSFVNTSQLSSNLSNYQTSAGLSANVAGLTSNNSTHLGGITLAALQDTITANSANAYANSITYVGAQSFVNTSQLSSNLSNYQTSAGLSANVATLTSNNALFLGGVDAASYITNTGVYTISGIHTHSANIIFNDNKVIIANGSFGTDMQVLSSNGTSMYWATVTGGGGGGTVTNIATGNGLTGGPITSTGTISVLANTGIVSNTTGVFVNSSYISTLTSNNALYFDGISLTTLRSEITANSANAYSNAIAYVDGKSYVNTSQLSANLSNYQTSAGLSANVATLTSNNSLYLGGVVAASYVNTSQLSSNLSNYAILSGSTFTGQVNVSTLNTLGNTSIGGSLTVSGNLTIGGNVTVINANNLSLVDNMIYLNNGSTTSNPDIGFAANYNDGTYAHTGFFRDHASGTWKVFDNYALEPDASVYINQGDASYHNANFQANVIFVGNNTVYSTINTTSFTGTSNNTLNAFGKSEVNLNVNNALTSNDSSYLGGVVSSSYVNTSQLSSNLALYQTSAGLSANVATLTSNNALYLDDISLITLRSEITSNATAAYTNAVAYVDGKSYVNTSQLSSNLALYQTSAGLSANVITLTSNNALFLGGVDAASYVNTSGAYTISGIHTHSGNTIFNNWVDLKVYTEVETAPTISAGTLTLDLSTSSIFDVSLNNNITTLTISNIPATSGKATGFVLILTADGTLRSVDWGSLVRWANNTPPTITSTNTKRDVFTFFTTDNGTSYNGFITGQNI